MKKYIGLYFAFLAAITLYLGCKAQVFTQKTTNFSHFAMTDSNSDRIKKFTEGMYILQFCRSSHLADDSLTSLISYKPCEDFVDFLDENKLKQTISLIFLDDKRFLYCTGLNLNGQLLDEIDISENTISKDILKKHIFRGYYTLTKIDSANYRLDLEMEKPIQKNGKPLLNGNKKVAVIASFDSSHNKILFDRILFESDKDNIRLNGRDGNVEEISTDKAFNFTPCFNFYRHKNALEKEITYDRLLNSLKLRVVKKNSLTEGDTVVRAEDVKNVFESFDIYQTDFTLSQSQKKLTLVHYIRWKKVAVTTVFQKKYQDTITFENDKDTLIKVQIESHLSNPFLLALSESIKNNKISKDEFRISRNSKTIVGLDSLMALLVDKNNKQDLTDYILNAHKYNHIIKKEYHDHDEYALDNTLNPIFFSIKRRGKNGIAPKPAIVIKDNKGVKKVVTKIDVTDNMRIYRADNEVLLSEKRDSIKTW